MDTITITPFKEGMDMEKTKRELDIHADGYRQGYRAAIDRACEWLKANIHNDLSIGTYVDTVETLVEDFVKEMEE